MPGEFTQLYYDRDGKKAYRWTKGEITDEVLKAHVGSIQPIGICPNVDGEKSHFLVLDFNDHSGKRDQFLVKQVVISVASYLRDLGYPHFIVRSGGGHGYHL